MLKKSLAAVLLSTLVAAPAFAADEGFYIGLTAGQGKTDNVATNTTMTSDTSGVAGILAGYQFNKNWGAEAFFTGIGKYTAVGGGVTTNGKADAYGVVAVGTLPLSDAFSLYAKLGIASTKNSVTTNVVSNVSSANRTAGTYGVGAQYNVSPAIGIRLGWDSYGESLNVAPGTNKYNANVWSLGAVFKF